MAIPQPDRYSVQQERLRAFLTWLSLLTGIFGVLEAVAFAFFQDRAFGIASLTTFSCFGCFLTAHAQLRRGRVRAAALIVYAAILGAALVGGVFWPSLLPMVVLLPLLALVIVLPYFTGRALYALIFVGWFIIITAAVLKEILPGSSAEPAWVVSVFRISSLGSAAALVLLLLVQFSSWLMDLVVSMERANVALQATAAELEAQRERLALALRERETAVALHRSVEERLAALTEAASTLLSSPQQQTVLSGILDLSRQVLAADAYAAWRVDATLPQWRVVHAVGLSESFQETLTRAPSDARTIPPEPVVISDITALPPLVASRLETYRREGIQALLVMPMRIQGEMGGTLVLYYRQPHAFSELEVRVATALAHLAAAAITTAELYDEQNRLRIAAEAAVRLRDQFLSVAAHELKTPLTSLSGNAQLMQRRALREGTLSERDLRNLQVIVDQASRLHKMVLSMLDIARIETGQLTIERTPMDLCAFVRRVVDEAQPALDGRPLQLICPLEALIVDGDELRLEQVLQNLLQNAAKYSPATEPIAIEVARSGAQVRLAVTDRGIGIPQAALPQLFQRFYRADNVDEQHISGMGIGLYVVKEIVTLHGGSVVVESIEGQGSTFTVCLPLAG